MTRGNWETRQYCGYVTDRWKPYREMAARKFGGTVVDAYMPEGYCIIADGEDLIAVRLQDREEIFRTPDPVPNYEAWQEVHRFMLEKGVISGFDYFWRCDNDLARRLPALQMASAAAEAD